MKKVTLSNKKIDQMESFTYFCSIISKDDGNSEDVKSKKPGLRVFFHS